MNEEIEIQKNDFEKIVIAVKEFKGHRYIDIRSYSKDDPRYAEKADADAEIGWKPTAKGVTVPLKKAGELRRAIDRLFAEHEFEEEE